MSDPLPSFARFTEQARARGFDEVIERRWAPLSVVETHRHPFALWALVTEGEMWLSIGAETRRLTPGSEFELAAEAPHAERYGPEGATYWVARRHGA